ncbi:MAG: PAS domain S-box protein [Betaproteobacteria bacterium]|nr:PAS domain S-box protein [Betaproteobacteria bacterium]
MSARAREPKAAGAARRRTATERLELALEASQLALWDADLVAGRIHLSPLWKQMLGEPAAATDAAIAEVFALVHPQDVEAARDGLVRAVKGETGDFRSVHRVRRADGSWIWIQSHGRVVDRMPDGRARRVVGTNVDVTERETAKHRLAARERDLRAMTDNMPAMVALIDRDMRYRYANRRYCAFFGLDPEAIAGRTVAEALGEEAGRFIAPYVRRALDGDMAHYEREMRDGRARRWIDVVLFPDVDESWEVRGCYALSIDVTPRKESELALRDSEARFRSLVELSSDWYWEQDANLRFTRLEGAMFSRQGIDPATLLGKTRWEIGFDNVSEPEWAEHRARLARHEPFADFLGVRHDPDGGIRQALLVSGRPIFDEAGRFTGYRGVGRDVSRRLRSEQELARAHARVEEAEARLRTAIDSLDDGFALFDAQDRLVLCNERYREYYPLSRDAIVPGARFEDIIRAGAERGEYPSAVGRIDAWVAERLDQHRRAESTIEQEHADGRWLRISERRTPEGGTVGVRVDITALKDAQARAEAASRAKGDFLATMSHEIRTPITGVLGIAELLLDTRLDPGQRAQVQTILRSGHSLLRILNDVLDHAKVEAGLLRFESAPFDLARVVEDTVALHAARAAAKGIKLEARYDPMAPRHLRGDGGRLHQVLGNLVGNAVKFTERGGVVIEVDGSRLNGDRAQMRVAVRDTGPGVSREDAARLFQPYVQAGSAARRSGGTGLGLAISRRLVEAMGGTIELDSAPGRGSTFRAEFTLPLDAPPRDSAQRPREEPSSAKLRGKVLVAEDNEVNRQVTLAFLERFGLDAQAVENGVAAVEAAVRGQHDLVLMDMNMPEMDGIEATRRIRAHEARTGARRVPIVALTASVMQDTRVEALAAGIDDFAAKPIVRKEFAATLARWVGGQVAVDHERLERLRADIGDGFVRVLRSFLESVPTMISAMTAACAGGNMQEVHRLAHSMRSSSATLGALRLAALAAEAETRAQAGEPPDALAARIAALSAEFARVHDELARIVARA